MHYLRIKNILINYKLLTSLMDGAQFQIELLYINYIYQINFENIR